jgi:beta-lactamase superfamily II metal-dependent hydrolase
VKGELTLHILPAQDGDCLLLRAKAEDGDPFAVLIDGGRAASYSKWKPHLNILLGSRPIIDLLVVTHIDADHIEGILKFLEDGDRNIKVSEVWYNGFDQVSSALSSKEAMEAFSYRQADDLSKILTDLKLPWNSTFNNGPICRELALDQMEIGPFMVRVVTPSRKKLAALAGPWEALIAQARKQQSDPDPEGLEGLGIDPLNVDQLALTDDKNDTAKPNGSSISLIFEAFGGRLLLAGDSHPDDLAAGLSALGASPSEPQMFVVAKVSHHGAKTNTTRVLQTLIRAKTYVFSTDGSHRDHPDASVVAKIIKSSTSAKILAFNYRTSTTAEWDDESLMETYGYSVAFPDDNEPGYLRLPIVD